MKKALALILSLALLLALGVPALAFNAQLSAQSLTVNGKAITCEKYNIDGSNYFKLRDLAQLLNGTESQFDVGWDGEKGVVSITTNHAYTTPNGTELVVGADQSATTQVSAQTIMINGAVRTDLTVYNIGGSNFFKLRELGDALGFAVDYDAATNTAIVKSTGGDTPAPSAAWPSGPVTIYSAYAEGSLYDSAIEIIADWITKQTGTAATVERVDASMLCIKLMQAAPDGQSIFVTRTTDIDGLFYGPWWFDKPVDERFKFVGGSIQPDPEAGYILLAPASAPYSTWEEMVAYIKAHPGELTMPSRTGSVVDYKLKSLFLREDIARYVHWMPCSSAEAIVGMLNCDFGGVLQDEIAASKYMADGTCKGILNCRVSTDWSMYTGEDLAAVDIIRGVPTLTDVFGADAEACMVPNRYALTVPGGTPDEVCAAITAIVGKLSAESADSELYAPLRDYNSACAYYSLPGDALMAEWSRLAPTIKAIYEMG